MKKFEEDMKKIVNNTCDMGNLTVSLLKDSVSALVNDDVDKAKSVIERFDRITYYDELIEEDAIRILTLYQPTAVDIRTLSTILKSITYMERTSKNCKNTANAELVIHESGHKQIPEIGEMGRIATEMIEISVDGFRNKNIEGFDRLRMLDDRLDALRNSSLADGVALIEQNPMETNSYIQSITVSRYLERIGDQACKIAEKVTYMVCGKHVEIDI